MSRTKKWFWVYYLLINIFIRNTLCKRSIFDSYFDLYKQNEKVTSRIIARKTKANLLTCSHTCMLNTNCGGFNHCLHSEKYQCTLFSWGEKDIFSDVIDQCKGCSIYLLKEVICSPDPCQHSSDCQPQSNGEFKCENCDQTKYLGKYCERDVSFYFVLNPPVAYLSTPLPSLTVDALTVCTTITMFELDASDRIIFQINQQKCHPWIVLKVNTNKMSLVMTGESSTAQNTQEFVKGALFKDLPTSVCFRWRSSDGEVNVKVRNQRQYKDYQRQLPSLSINATINFGGPPFNNQQPCGLDEGQPQLTGKMHYIMVYKRYLSDEEITELNALQWIVDDSLIITMDYLKDLNIFGWGNVTKVNEPMKS